MSESLRTCARGDSPRPGPSWERPKPASRTRADVGMGARFAVRPSAAEGRSQAENGLVLVSRGGRGCRRPSPLARTQALGSALHPWKKF